jgi:hypothetical protein
MQIRGGTYNKNDIDYITEQIILKKKEYILNE